MAEQTLYRKRQLLLRKGEPTIAPEHRVKNVQVLRTLLQNAIALELVTIPPYLCALYSIKDGTNQQAAEIIQSVVMEEMLHMALAANILNAIGGHPVIYQKEFIPEYPKKLPSLGSGIEVHLDRFSRESITTFYDLERPDDKLLDQPTGCNCIDDYRSIGQFYEAIEVGLRELSACGENIFTGNPDLQITPEHYYGGGGKAIRVTDLKSASKAINEIIGQGEGVSATIWGDDELNPGVEDFLEVAHFFRFDQILKGKRYKKCDYLKSDPTGETLNVQWDKVYPMRKNPKMGSCPPGSPLLEKTTAFNRTYMSLLKFLHDATNGKPELLMQSVAIMYEIKYRAIELMKIPMPCGNETAGPSFEYLPPG